ncbi:MAG: hypothetical protein IH891_04855 [Planctomycetes bacterium]|nr:hypothetical protein [Planctomycetota bacterium]
MPVPETPRSDDPPPSNSEAIPMFVPLVETLESPEALPPLENDGEENPHS